jgi:hypothetical protein
MSLPSTGTAGPVLCGSEVTRSPGRRTIMAVAVVLGVELMIMAARHAGLARLAVLLSFLAFGGLVLWCRRDARSLTIPGVMIIAAVCQLPGALVRPLLSDDAYRYVWDGRVQLAGIDPYRYVPLDPALAGLRDPLLFPPGAALPLINRPWVHTIYPPVAQLWFTAVAAVTPWRAGTLGVQIGAALLVVLATGLLARVMIISSGRADAAGRALIYGACPATVLEAANGAHVDVLAASALIGMGWAVLTGRRSAAGLLLGLATGVKLVPLLLAPVFLRRRRFSALGTAVATVVSGYLPHLVAVGWLVIGFLPGYLAEEGFDGRRRFALLIFLPEPARLPAAVLIAALLALLAVARSTREPVLITCCWLYGAAFLVATPTYPWYLLPMVVLALMAGRPEWLLLWPAAYLGYLHDREPILQTIGFGTALIGILIIAGIRRGRGRPASSGGPVHRAPELASLHALHPARRPTGPGERRTAGSGGGLGAGDSAQRLPARAVLQDPLRLLRLQHLHRRRTG